MTRLGKGVAVSVLLVLLGVAPVAGQGDKRNNPEKDPIKDLDARIEDLKTQLKIAQDKTDALTKSLSNLTDLAVAQQNQISHLTKRLDRMKQTSTAQRLEISDLSRRVDELETSRRVTTTSGFRGTGTIVIRNTLAVPATVTIDGQPYRVDPSDELPVTKGAGTFRYSISARGLSGSGTHVVSLARNEKLTIRVFDPRDPDEE